MVDGLLGADMVVVKVMLSMTLIATVPSGSLEQSVASGSLYS